MEFSTACSCSTRTVSDDDMKPGGRGSKHEPRLFMHHIHEFMAHGWPIIRNLVDGLLYCNIVMTWTGMH